MVKFKTTEAAERRSEKTRREEILELPVVLGWQFKELQRHPVPKLNEELEKELLNQYGELPERRRIVLIIGTTEVWVIQGHAYYLEDKEEDINAVLHWDEKGPLYPQQFWEV